MDIEGDNDEYLRQQIEAFKQFEKSRQQNIIIIDEDPVVTAQAQQFKRFQNPQGEKESGIDYPL